VLLAFDARQHLPFRGTVAFQLIGDQSPFEEPAKEFLRGLCVASLLHEYIEDIPFLIYCPPQIVALPIDRKEDFIGMPLVTRLRASASELIGIWLAEFPTPFADRLIGDDDPTGEQEFFDIRCLSKVLPTVTLPTAQESRSGRIPIAGDRAWCGPPPRRRPWASAPTGR
jgi:hypothetical protein